MSSGKKKNQRKRQPQKANKVRNCNPHEKNKAGTHKVNHLQRKTKRPSQSIRKPNAVKKKRHVRKTAKRSKVYVFLFRLVFVLLGFIFLMVGLILADVDRARASDESMMPSVKPGDTLLVKRKRTISRFDLVVLTSPKKTDSRILKRVIGMPGDMIYYQDDFLYLNGKKYTETYTQLKREEYEEQQEKKMGEPAPFTTDFTLAELPGVPKKIKKIPANHYLVLGDNRQSGIDSRDFGLVSEADIIGVVFKKIPARS